MPGSSILPDGQVDSLEIVPAQPQLVQPEEDTLHLALPEIAGIELAVRDV